MYNNIWWSSTPETKMWESQWGDDREPDYLDYNLYAFNGKYRENRYTSGSESYASLAEWNGVPHPLSYDLNSLEGDPLFVDIASGDFHLQAGSPARDQGRFGEDMGAYPRRDGTTIGPRQPAALPALPPWGLPVLAALISGLSTSRRGAFARPAT